MTEQRSNYTGQYFRFVLGNLKTCIILSCIFSLCGFPVEALYDLGGLYDFRGILALLGVTGIGGISVMSFVAPLIAFKHLYTKTAADNILSLPLTTAQRYVCEAGASILSFALPYAATLPITLALNLARKDGQLVMSYAVAGLFLLIMFAAFNILLTGFCGRLAEAIIYPAVINVLIPLFFATGTQLARANAFGLTSLGDFSSNGLFGIVGLTSPLGCFVYILFFTEQTWKMLIVAVIFAAVMLALGYLVYKNRRVENIGRPFVYKRAYNIVSVAIVIGCIVVYFAWQVIFSLRSEVFGLPQFIVLAVLVLILMLVMEFVNFKKVHNIGRFTLKFLCTFTAGCLLSGGLYVSEGFGEALYVPKAEEVSFVSVSVFSVEKQETYSSVRFTVDFYVKGDCGLAQLVIDEHKTVLNERNSGNDSLSLDYYLKNGANVVRRYRDCALSEDFMRQVLESEDYRYSEILSYEYVHKNNNADEIGKNFAVELQNPYNDESSIIANVDYAGFKEAIIKDLKNDANYGRHNEPPIARIGFKEIFQDDSGVRHEYTMGGGIMLYESYTNTVELLKRYGRVPTAEEMLEDLFRGNEASLFTIERCKKPNTQHSVLPRPMNVMGASAVLVSADEFKEAAANIVDYIKPEGQEYVYFLNAGVPDYFYNVRGNGHGFEPEIAEQLETMGYGDMSGDMYNMASRRYLLSEEYYPVIEKYFAERHVFTDPEAEKIVSSGTFETASDRQSVATTVEFVEYADAHASVG